MSQPLLLAESRPTCRAPRRVSSAVLSVPDISLSASSLTLPASCEHNVTMCVTYWTSKEMEATGKTPHAILAVAPVHPSIAHPTFPLIFTGRCPTLEPNLMSFSA